MRRHDWTDRLFATVEAYRCVPFEWGQHDCCLFTARVVDAMCDTDYAGQLAREYHNERSALAYIARMGGLESALTAWLDQPLPRVAMIRRGDVVLFRDAGGTSAVGICIGATIVSTSPDGQALAPISAAFAGWRVG